MIEVQNLSKTFLVHKKKPGLKASVKALFIRNWIEKVALDKVSFSVPNSDIVGVVGPNGAGKTTLMKILSGIINPNQGLVRVLGFDPWQRNNEYRRQIALIMGQKAQLWWDLPAADCFLLLKEIYSAIKNTEDLDRLNNSYTSHSDYKLNFYNKIEDVLSTPASVLILDNFSEDGLTINFCNYKSIIIINSNGILNRVGNTNAFKLITKEDNLSIFKKIED